ncbi:hypothetical protein MHEI_36630 [Mycobacterium heidelbergense]|nr:hypothetical protein MHEI_36630 [Mycobacterium heidelbergense]
MLSLALMPSKYPDTGSELLAVGAAAGLVGVSVDTLRRWERNGRIIALRTPTGHRRFRRADIEALLAEEVSVS